jgi:uncharacterized protein (DUF1499 family)
MNTSSQTKKTGATMKLPPCPASPNCVTSQDPDEAHAIRPFEYTGSPADARRALIAALESMPRTRIVSRATAYIRVEFRSPFFKFLDVGEFVIREQPPVIDVRSASQKGYYDFGVNRKRLEDLRRRFDEKLAGQKGMDSI